MACLRDGILGAALAAAGLAATVAIAADDVTAWNGDARSGVRSFAGQRPVGVSYLRAGVEIRLAPGWHTYWRYPGDSGVPPHFDFSGSRNLHQADVLWPAPERLAEAGGTSIGYSGNVVFPVRILAQEPGKPVLLRLRLQYAICEKLCVPAEARSELTLGSGAASQEAALRDAEARVPKRLNLGEGGELSIRALRIEQVAGGKERAVVDVAGPAGVDLFVEGPSRQWSLPVPTALDDAPPGLRRFAFDLDGAPAGEPYRGALLTLTAVAGSRAIEVVSRLD